MAAGYDFLSLSDHNTLTQTCDTRLTFIPGIEWNAAGGNEHTGLYAADPAVIAGHCATTSQTELLDALAPTAALVILNHPNWQLTPHYRREALLATPHYDGIEIFNGVITRCQGYAIASDKWDYLLANQQRVLGFASDDSHSEQDIGKAWIAVRAPSREAGAILAAIKAGNFYGSSGVTITDIRAEDDGIAIETEDGEEIQVIADGGMMIHRVFDRQLVFKFGGITASYVRFAVYGKGSAMAWTQPFFPSSRD